MKSWYPHYPGDYQRDTGHLSLIEEGAYRRLLDHYYSTGEPLPANAVQLHRICRAFGDDEQTAIATVLDQFFTLEGDVYRNGRADRELEKANDISVKRANAAKKRHAKASANAPAIAHTTTTTTTDKTLSNDNVCPKDAKALLTFPTTGNPKEWSLTQTKLDEWQGTYATIDVLGRCKVALQWIKDNPSKRKTARGMPRFLSAWMERDSNNPKVPKINPGAPAAETRAEADPAKMYYDWDGAGVQTFENRHKVRHADFADKLRIDLADLSKQKFTQKYHQTPDTVRSVLEAWNY